MWIDLKWFLDNKVKGERYKWNKWEIKGNRGDKKIMHIGKEEDFFNYWWYFVG